MPVTASNNTKLIKQILTTLKETNRVMCSLPGEGFLHLENDLPFLLIYRKKKESDPGTMRLVKSAGSYLIIGLEEVESTAELIYNLTDYLSAIYKSFLLLEIYSGPPQSNNFIIKGPLQKTESTLQIFQKEFNSIPSHKYGLNLNANIKETKNRQAENEKALLDLTRLKNSGGLLIGIEVPPVYKSEENHLYPVFFRQFRDHFSRVIQKGVYDFIRVQTSSGILSYTALGKRNVHDEVFKIDKQLTEIESSYQFLLLVSPVNIRQMRETFFESNFTKLPEYHYRLLPIDPDLLKRKLFNLRIDEIDDPALSHLYNEKRRELDIQISMLNERGTKDFFYNSIRLYQRVDDNLKYEAQQILEQVPESLEEDASVLIDAKEFCALARKEFEYFKSQDANFTSKVHIREDVNIMMVSQGELYVPADYKLSLTSAKALIQHEIGTHALTYYNGKQQPLSQLAVGLADYDPLQEGIAVLSEYLIGGLTGNRLRVLAGRVKAGAAVLEGATFQEVFRMLLKDYNFSRERAFNITSRVLQGGGFIKDIIYLKGLVHVIKYMKDGGQLEPLLAGKYALNHLKIIEELTERKILNTPKIKPRYLELDDYNQKLSKIREGMPLSQMITK
ncbi:flavohemoglobin expression-modulating QEGLA motif protein [Gillisia sp. M10.2A]|uniref:Flavohemoglobin expression-modulating QEGLA motif protein n=1 Tax=Gillisia lutea TaxID=2909668 RepID=A0ABS9EFI0_9FLAO|nr:tyrosine/phenylalanine carboxypeptidase domain-containing protein [Gillisia lutea]MCF4101652.1 flavohemoglobin expression-modulating QEGLA motif protein [Gillisia lutea]